MRQILPCCVAMLVAGTAFPAYGATFLVDATISDVDFLYDGQDIVVDGATLTVDESHAFASVALLNGATLTHTQGFVGGLELDVTGVVSVDASSRVDLDGRGSDTYPGASGRSGATYGGRGVDNSGGTSNATWGDWRAPSGLGLGGSCDVASVTFGGGSLRLITSELVLDGTMSADGTGSEYRCGGGSGGSIWIDVGQLSGSGAVSANGGVANASGAGGGGRVALSYDGVTTFDLDQVAARGGNGAGAGTIFLTDQGSGTEALRIDNGTNGVTGLPGTELIWTGLVDELVVRHGTVTVVGNGRIDARGDVRVEDEGTLRHLDGATTGLGVYAMGAVVVDPTSAIDVSELGVAGDPASLGRQGGSHGGWGEAYNGAVGAPHGDPLAPLALGAGGDSDYNLPSFGGGAVTVDASRLQLDGAILADGTASQYRTGGGSGGSVWVRVGELAGVGVISAEGGSGNASGAGGGGRIAIVYDLASTFDPDAQVRAAGGTGGGAGTIVLDDTGAGTRTLRLDNGSRVSRALASPVAGADVGSVDQLLVRDGAIARLDAFLPSGDAIVSSAQLELTGGPLVLSGDLDVLGTGVVRHPAADPVGVDMLVDGTVTVGVDALIDVSGLGDLADPGTTARSGGSHGGWGAASLGVAVAPHGDPLGPRTHGLGGASDNGTPTRGGGRIRLSAAVLQLDGAILSDGEGSVYRSGGGAGGSIWLDVGVWSGTGLVRARGGAANASGSGGGGRIAVAYDSAGFDLDGGVVATSRATAAGAGTILLHDRVLGERTLRVDNGSFGVNPDPTPIAWPAGMVDVLDLRNANTRVVDPSEVRSIDVVDGRAEVDGALLRVTDTLTLRGTGRLTSTATSCNGLRAWVGGSVSIEADASLDGNAAGAWPTPDVTGRSGGSHGGLGVEYLGTTNTTYGSADFPEEPGTGGSGDLGADHRGGAAVRLVTPLLDLAGSLSSDGEGSTYRVGGGSGGSVWLDVDTLTGSGAIHARGGLANASGGGGGGRVAVYATDDSGFTGSVDADGSNGAGAGSVVLGTGTGSAVARAFEAGGNATCADLCQGDDISGDSDADGVCDDLDFTLDATPPIPRTTMTFTATDAPANARVWFLVSPSLGATPTCHPTATAADGVSPVCTPLRRPTVLADVVADTSGTATIDVNVPRSLASGFSFYAQAFTLSRGVGDVTEVDVLTVP